MYINLFEKRILYNERVYLLVKDCADVLDTTLQEFLSHCRNVASIVDIGDCILESEFNDILQDVYSNSHALAQFTHYETLENKASDIFRLYPMKRMFAEEMLMRDAGEYGMTVEEYINLIDFPNEVEKEKEKLNRLNSLKETIANYKEEVKNGIDSVQRIPFEKFGLELQHLTILENGHVNFRSYYAGDGIFWWVMPDMMVDDCWDEAEQLENGTIKVPSADYSDGYMILSKTVDRDFRKHSVMDNILYCVQNLQAKDEWTDSIEIRDGGINVEVTKSFLMKMINPKNLPDIYYFEGIEEFNR